MRTLALLALCFTFSLAAASERVVLPRKQYLGEASVSAPAPMTRVKSDTPEPTAAAGKVPKPMPGSVPEPMPGMAPESMEGIGTRRLVLEPIEGGFGTYKCVIENAYTFTWGRPEQLPLPSEKEFVIDRGTGIMLGAVRNFSQLPTLQLPTLLALGRGDQPFTAITIYKLGPQLEVFIDVLLMRETPGDANPHFFFIKGLGPQVLSGTCVFRL